MKNRGNTERYLFADAIKILAIFLVVLFHVLYELSLDNSLRWIGFLGISLFFIVSGFLLTKKYSYLENFSIRWFFKRYLKIAPLYYLSLIALTLLFSTQIYRGSLVNNLLIHFFFLDYFFPYYQYSIISPAWFLVPLICLYFFFPYLNRIIKKYPLSIIFFFALTFLVRVLAGTYISYSPLFFLADFCFGIAVAYKTKPLLFVLPLIFIPFNGVMAISYYIFLLFSHFSFSKINSKVFLILSGNTLFIFLFHESFMKVILGVWNIYGTPRFIGFVILLLVSLLILTLSNKLQRLFLGDNKTFKTLSADK